MSHGSGLHHLPRANATAELRQPLGWGGAREAQSNKHLDKIGALLARKGGGTRGVDDQQSLLDDVGGTTKYSATAGGLLYTEDLGRMRSSGK